MFPVCSVRADGSRVRRRARTPLAIGRRWHNLALTTAGAHFENHDEAARGNRKEASQAAGRCGEGDVSRGGRCLEARAHAQKGRGDRAGRARAVARTGLFGGGSRSRAARCRDRGCCRHASKLRTRREEADAGHRGRSSREAQGCDAQSHYDERRQRWGFACASVAQVDSACRACEGACVGCEGCGDSAVRPSRFSAGESYVRRPS
jgi:hypothetical protein